MEANGVKMKPLYALKKMCEEYTIDRVIGGSILKRYENVLDNVLKNREQGIEQASKAEKDNSMFGQEVLEELGITKEVSGGYVMAENKETQEQSQEDEMVL